MPFRDSSAPPIFSNVPIFPDNLKFLVVSRFHVFRDTSVAPKFSNVVFFQDHMKFPFFPDSILILVSIIKPMRFETHGRMGRLSASKLRSLAAACTKFYSNARGLSAAQVYGHWRRELERVLLYEISDVVLLSLGHSSGAHSMRATRRGDENGRQARVVLPG